MQTKRLELPEDLKYTLEKILHVFEPVFVRMNTFLPKAIPSGGVLMMVVENTLQYIPLKNLP